MKTTILLFLGLALPGLALAEASSPDLPVVSLNAHARAQVPADEMTVSLSAEAQGPTVGPLNQKVLADLQTAMKQATAYSGVHARLGSVNTAPEYGNQGKVTGWRVRGELILDSKELKNLGDLTGVLSQRLQLNQVAFRVADATRMAAERLLLEEASQRFQDKARLSAKALGYSGYRLKELQVSGSGEGSPRPYMAMKTMAMAAESLPVEGGTVDVSVALSGSVLLEK